MPQNAEKYRKMPKNSVKCRKIPQNAEKYRKIPQNAVKYRKLPKLKENSNETFLTIFKQCAGGATFSLQLFYKNDPALYDYIADDRTA